MTPGSGAGSLPRLSERHRPREGRFAGQRAAPRPQSARVHDAFERVLRGCLQTGAQSFSYADPWDLWRELLPEYRDWINALARRADTLSLGAYRLDEFNGFYTALIAVCAAHEFPVLPVVSRWPTDIQSSLLSCPSCIGMAGRSSALSGIS